jgi:ABC-2 type transport system ATP-binding protein
MNIIETSGLGRRYGGTGAHGGTWALRDCTLAIPEGHLIALVGPNGAGKSTLLNVIVGLTAATVGEVRVLGGLPAGSIAALDGIAYVAQDTPLYRNLSVADMVHLTRNLNHRFDSVYAAKRLSDLNLSATRKAGKLSGGQQAQLALTLALARHPRLLVLDEPTARLDPLARHDFMATVMTAMADDGITVMLSSHVLAELERVADFLVLMTHGRIRLAGEVEVLLAEHRLITGPANIATNATEVIAASTAGFQAHRLVRMPAAAVLPNACEARPVGIEELAMAYLRESTAYTTPNLTGATR